MITGVCFRRIHFFIYCVVCIFRTIFVWSARLMITFI